MIVARSGGTAPGVADSPWSTATPPKPHSLPTFFLLAFGLSWAVWVPTNLASRGLLSFPLPLEYAGLLGAFGPAVAALVTAGIFDGGRGLRALLGRFLIWRVGICWYAFVLLWPAALSLATTALHVLLGGAAPDFAQPPFVRLNPLPSELSATSPFALLPFVFLQQTLVGSSMGEEPGWRGYALPRLQWWWGALPASLLLGTLWGVWHLPLWLTRGHEAGQTFVGWALLGLVAHAILFTWVYNHTRGSLLLALLFHTADAITGMFLSTAAASPLLGLALSWGAALLVVAASGPDRLSHRPAREYLSEVAAR